MNPQSFIGSIATGDPENFIENLKNIFNEIHIADVEN